MHSKNATQKHISLLDKSLGVFFSTALRITLRHPRQAYFFFKTVQWQRKAIKTRAAMAQQGTPVPPMLIYSITERCNLRCKGCYAQALHNLTAPEMNSEKMRDTIREARELGVSFMILAGGEPLVRKEILDIIDEYKDVIFMVFTNGTLINDETAERMKKMYNVVPVISLEGREEETDRRRGEGVFQRLEKVMRRLQQRNVFFGISITVTSDNIEMVTDGNFIRDMYKSGCRLFFLSEYTPIDETTENWQITETQREIMASRVAHFRKQYKALYVSVPDDEKDFGGCLSSGRGFVHISAQGDVEPCPFAPYSDTNLRDTTLKEALKSDFLTAVRENSEHLEEGVGGCALWREREWLKTTLANAKRRKDTVTEESGVEIGR